MIKNVAIGIVIFYLGRLSHKVWLDHAISQKFTELKQTANDLAIIARQLDEKDVRIREKWQEMVSDIATYQFAGTPSNKWTNLDDQYLQSWSSAEK